MTEQLHRLIDSGAAQPVINERIAALLEVQKVIGNDHEKRMRYLERTVAWALGGIGAISTVIVILGKFFK
jgi:hypothetical protein